MVARRLLRPGLEEDVMLTVTATAVKEKELDAGRTVAEVSGSHQGSDEISGAKVAYRQSGGAFLIVR